LIDIPDDVFHHGHEKRVNLLEYARQYHQDRIIELVDDRSNALQCLGSNVQINLFVELARRNRTAFIDYERSQFCLFDSEKRKREGARECLSFMKGSA
jgi:hypothetical protein